MALTLVYYEEFSQAEAARIMNITTSALEALLFRGKKGLKQRLTP
jgi:DNA-directed RNA polymerase specialized sigma24 family protein